MSENEMSTQKFLQVMYEVNRVVPSRHIYKRPAISLRYHAGDSVFPPVG